MGGNTGFGQDNFDEHKLTGLYAGIISDRKDPEGLGRVRVQIPGIIDESAWCLPKGSGAGQWGSNIVPPIGADVYIQFVNGNIDRPVYEAGWPGKPDGEAETFPEFEDPDVAVFGIGPFRLVIDNREDQETAVAKMVRDVNGTEESMIEFTLEKATNSLKVFVQTAMLLEAGGLINIDANQVQIRERVVLPINRPIQ